MHLEVTVGDEIVFDGSHSKATDDNDKIVKYAWDFGDGTVIDGDTNMLSLSKIGDYANGVNTDIAKPSHIYYEAGGYTVTLTVTDNKGGTDSIEAEIIALPVAARIKFSPYKFYLNSRAKWIWATIRLPSGFDARKIDDPSVCIVLEDGSSTSICANSDYGHGWFAKLRKRLYRKKRSLTVRFDRQKLIELIQKDKIPSGKTTLTVQGVVLDTDNGGWVEFEGSGKIRTIEKKKKHHNWSKYWKRCFKRFYSKH
jgi:PKD repeat protein